MIVPQTYKHWCSKLKISNTLFLPNKLHQLVLKTQTTCVPAQSLGLQHKAPGMNTYTQMAMDIIIMMLKKMSVGLNQGHLRSTQPFPPSSYSCLDTHICWKEPCNNKKAHLSCSSKYHANSVFSRLPHPNCIIILVHPLHSPILPNCIIILVHPLHSPILPNCIIILVHPLHSPILPNCIIILVHPLHSPTHPNCSIPRLTKMTV